MALDRRHQTLSRCHGLHFWWQLLEWNSSWLEIPHRRVCDLRWWQTRYAYILSTAVEKIKARPLGRLLKLHNIKFLPLSSLLTVRKHLRAHITYLRKGKKSKHDEQLEWKTHARNAAGKHSYGRHWHSKVVAKTFLAIYEENPFVELQRGYFVRSICRMYLRFMRGTRCCQRPSWYWCLLSCVELF